MLVANIIKHNQFGRVLLKEDFSEENVLEAISETLLNYPTYRGNMQLARQVLDLAPATPQQIMLYNIDLLVRLKKLPYTVNRVRGRQSYIQSSNLDIRLACLGGLVVFVVMLYWAVRAARRAAAALIEHLASMLCYVGDYVRFSLPNDFSSFVSYFSST